MSDAPATTPAAAAPIVETPAAPVATSETTPAVTESPAVVEPAVAATEAPVEEPAKVEAPVEAAAAEEVKPVEPKYDGHLNYNAPTSFLREILPLPPKKVFFWFGKEPIESKDLTHYLAKGKEAAHSTAAWAAQTGEGLLLFSKTGEKSAPTGVLNLADAEDLKEVGTNEFSFKAGGHKHKFEASNTAERDGWFTTVKKIAEEAKAKKEEILASESYKETLAKFSPVAAAAVVPAAKATEESPKKSVEAEEETPAEGLDTAKTDKSRSRSRGAPANIIGFFKGKKGEKSEEVKKEEEPAAAPAATPEVAAETVVPTEPTEETVAAPVVTDAVPAVEEKKDEPKPNRRMSRFESFFNKKGEKKSGEDTVAPAPETAVTEPAVVEPTAETPTVTEPVAETAAPTEGEAKATTPTKERKPSFLAGIQKLTQKVRSPSSEHPPAVAAESSAAEETPAVTEPVVDAPIAAAETSEAAPVTEEAPTSPTEKAEKRRSSLFDFKKFTQKPTKTTAEPAVAAAEPATTEEVKAVEEVAPVVPAAPAAPAAVEEPAKTSTEEKAVTEKAPKEHKESPIAQLGRRFSKAIRGGGGVKKETKTPAKVAENETDKVEPVSAEAPQLDKPTEAPAAIGDVVPEAVHTGTAPPASNTVSATA